MHNSHPDPQVERYRLMDIARGAIEQHLDTDDYGEDSDGLYSEAYSLAFDALRQAGVEQQVAADIARNIAQGYAQP